MPDKLEFSKSNQYKLSIRLSTDGFYFAFRSMAGGVSSVCRSWSVNKRRSMAANVKNFLQENKELQNNFAQTTILIDTSRYTTLPLEHYQDEQTELLFYQNLPKKCNENILCNILGNHNLVVLFAVDKLTHQFIIDNFPGARIYASVSPLVEELALRSSQGENRKLYASLHNETTDVLSFANRRLQLVNTYPTLSADDRCYYIAGVWKLLGYDSQRDELRVIGAESLCAETLSIMREMVRDCGSLDEPAGGMPFDLVALHNCES